MSSLTTEQQKALINQGFASYFELEALGIKKKYDLGKNEWGFRERLIIDEFDNQWDYIPEDQLYEKRDASNPHPCTQIKISD